MGNTILILHGWNLSSAKFQPLIKALTKKGFKVYCPDLPGFGQEAAPSYALHLSDYALFVSKYISEKKIKNAFIIGHSFGGRVALKLCATKGTLIKALVLSGTPGINPVPQLKILFFLYLAKFGKLVMSLPILNLYLDKARKLLYRSARATDFYNTDENLRATFKNIIREELTPAMRKISLPVLLIWGQDDVIVSLSVAKKMLKTLKNGRLIIINKARHGVPWTHADDFARHTADFARQL